MDPPPEDYPQTAAWLSVHQRLQTYPPTEWQLYGAIAAALRYIFPPKLGFLVRCQPRFVQLAHHFAGPNSTRRDSHGYLVSYPMTGSLVADFEVVCLSPKSDVILTVLVCEVKLHNDELLTGMTQLRSYMKRLSAGPEKLADKIPVADYRSKVGPIWGLLLVRDSGYMLRNGDVSSRCTGNLSDSQGEIYKELWGIRNAWAKENAPQLPTVTEGRKIPAWLEVLMMKMDTDTDSPEASFYGPQYEILCSQFPIEEEYFVKPQAPVLVKATPNTPLAHRRVTSFGYPAIIGEHPLYLVDFVVVKFTGYNADNVAKEKVIFAFEAKKYEEDEDRIRKPSIDKKLLKQIYGVLSTLHKFTENPYNGLITIGWDAWLVTWVNDNGTRRIQLPQFDDEFKITEPGEKLHNENASFWPVLRLAQPLPGP